MRAPLPHRASTILFLGAIAVHGCSSARSDCDDLAICPIAPSTTSSGMGGNALPCGGACTDDRPICDTVRDACVACTEDAQCVEADSARCDLEAGTCVPCDASPQCTGVDGATVCRTSDGVCVKCDELDASACDSNQTCDLTSGTCVDTPEGSLGLCAACTNSTQCGTGQACAQTRYKGINNGFFCLELGIAFSCDPPFKRSLSDRDTVEGALASVCGFDESTTSCGAIVAAREQRACTSDGFCTPPGGGASVEALGALCRSIQGVPGQVCTYGCAISDDCLASGPMSTCGPASHCGTPQL